MKAILAESIGMGRWLAAALALAGLLLWAAAFDGVAHADTTAPSILRIERLNAPANKSFIRPQKIEVGVVFNEEIKVTGVPQLELSIGNGTGIAGYIGTYNEDTAMRFSMVVRPEHVDKDGYSIAENSLKLPYNTITIKDRAGNDANLSHDPMPSNVRYRVNFTAPTLSHINPISYAGADNTYRPGDKIQFEAYFTEDVQTTDKETLTINMGSWSREAVHYSTYGNGITFEYTVTASDSDSDGVSLPSDPINLNGGAITDSQNYNAHLAYAGSQNYSNHKVQGTDTTAPTISRLAITSTPLKRSTYAAGEVIEVAVYFSEEVDPVGSTVDIQVGTSAKTAAYNRHQGSTVWYRYTVGASDLDNNGISIAANSVTAGSNNLADSADNAAVLTHAAISDDSNHKVVGTDVTPPKILRLERLNYPSSNKSYSRPQKIEIGVVFDEEIRVTKTPRLELTLGSSTAYSGYIGTYNNNTAMKFSMVVRPEHYDRDGYSIAANSLTLNSGTIQDESGNNANLTHKELPGDARWRVHFTGASLTHVNIVSHAGPDGIYHAGEKIQFDAHFTKVVSSSGSETLTFTMGTGTREATHYSTNLGTITFEYTVQAGDNDSDGVSLPANPINLNGGTITYSGNEVAEIGFAGTPAFGSHMVQGADTTAPTILRMAISSTPPTAESYTAGENIEVAVFFSEDIDPTGSTVDIEVGSNTRKAAYNRKHGATVWYQYTVVAADSDSDGISIDKGSITAGSNNLADGAGNAADLTHDAIGDDARHLVQGTDTEAPVINSISISSDRDKGHFKVGDTVEFTVQWNETVSAHATDRPTLSFLLDGNVPKTATFSSDNLESGHDKRKMLFEYTVVAGDMARKIGVPANAVQLTNNAPITDRAGNSGVLDSVAVDEFHGYDIFGAGGL